MKPLLTILSCLTCLGAMAQTSQFQVNKNTSNDSFDYWEIQGQPEWKEICSVKMDENKCATNIFISTNYTGTIQIGTNYFTVAGLSGRPAEKVVIKYEDAKGELSPDEFRLGATYGMLEQIRMQQDGSNHTYGDVLDAARRDYETNFWKIHNSTN